MSAHPYAFQHAPDVAPFPLQLIDLPLSKILAFQRGCIGGESEERLAELFGVVPGCAEITRKLLQECLPKGRALADLASRAPWVPGGLESDSRTEKAHKKMLASANRCLGSLLPCLHAIQPWVHADGVPEETALASIRMSDEVVATGKWTIELAALPPGQDPKKVVERIRSQIPKRFKPEIIIVGDASARAKTLVRLLAPTPGWPERGNDILKISMIVAFQVRAFCGFAAFGSKTPG